MSNSIGRSTLHLWQDITMGWNIFWMHNLKFLCICVLTRIYEKICSNHLVNTAGHQNGILFFCRCCLGWHSFGQPHEPIIFPVSCICLVLCGHFTINCSLAESFYYLNNGLSIIASKVSQIISVLNENINTGASVVCNQSLCFHYWDYLMSFWRNNWHYRKTPIKPVYALNYFGLFPSF